METGGLHARRPTDRLSVGDFAHDGDLAQAVMRSNCSQVPIAATADSVTEKNPWYFRTVADNRGEARFLADYLTIVLRARTATVVACSGDSGKTLAADFSRAYRKVHAVFGPDDAAVRLKATRARRDHDRLSG